MPGTSARSKRRRLARARRWPSRHRTRVVCPQPHTRGNCGERRSIIRSDDGRASGSRSLIPDETQSGFASGAKTSDPSQQHRRRDIIGIHMKKIILATVLAGIGSTSALAADLGARAPYSKAPAMVEAVGNWSGFYIGGTVGAAWTADKIRVNAEATPYFASLPGGSDAPAFGALGSPNIKQANVIFGGKAGYNWQASSWVLGLEGDLSSLRFRRAVTITGNPHAGFANGTSTFDDSASSDWLSTVRARVGYSYDRVLLFGTGGWALEFPGLGRRSCTSKYRTWACLSFRVRHQRRLG